MTISELINTLRGFYAEHGDIPVFDGRDYDFKLSSIRLTKCDDWDNAVKDDDGYETPAVGVAIAIGPRF